MGKFKVKKVTNLNESLDKVEVPESDYSLLMPDGRFVQFEYMKDEDKLEPLPIKPGVWTINKSLAGLVLHPAVFTKENILEQYVATKNINEKIASFFNNVETYRKYNIFPKRGILLYGKPGQGKSASISSVCREQSTDGKTAVVIWHTDKLDPNDVSQFIKSFDYEKHDVQKFILIAEDIGGVEMDQTRMQSDSGLLSLLDNMEQTFKIPTAIVATTNFISNFLDNLTNRPGRFDDKILVEAPKAEARAKFLEFFSNGEADEASKVEVIKKEYDKFSVAHVKEAFIRSKIYAISLIESLQQIKKEIELYEKAFEKRGASFGMNLE